MSLPKMGEESSRRSSTKDAGVGISGRPAGAPLLLSEMLLPPKSVRSSPQHSKLFQS